MIIAARVFSLLIVFLMVASTLLRLPRIFEVGPGEVLTTGGYVAAMVVSVLFPLLVCMPPALTLLSLGHARPRLLVAALITNCLYLFLVVAGLVGTMMVERDFSRVMFWVPIAAFFITCFALNIVALRKQRTPV